MIVGGGGFREQDAIDDVERFFGEEGKRADEFVLVVVRDSLVAQDIDEASGGDCSDVARVR